MLGAQTHFDDHSHSLTLFSVLQVEKLIFTAGMAATKRKRETDSLAEQDLTALYEAAIAEADGSDNDGAYEGDGADCGAAGSSDGTEQQRWRRQQ